MAVRSKNLLATAFHPELTEDFRWCACSGRFSLPLHCATLAMCCYLLLVLCLCCLCCVCCMYCLLA